MKRHAIGIVGLVLAIGFGAQSLVKDFVSGLFILIENQYGVGDRVKIGSFEGDVIKISIRSTVLMDNDKNEYFYDQLWRYIEDEIQNIVDDSYDKEEYESGLNDYLGSSINIIIDESDFYDESFETSREYFEPLESVLSKEQMEYLPKLGKDYQEDEVAIFLFTTNWDFITSFYRHKDDLPGADEF